MMAQGWAESTWEITNYGMFINQFPLNIIRSIRQLERITYIYIYIYIYTHSHIHTHIFIHQSVYIYMYIYIYIYTHTHTHTHTNMCSYTMVLGK